jgi:hypothetical protein
MSGHLKNFGSAERDRRRMEDRIREEHQDAHAKVIGAELVRRESRERQAREANITSAVVGRANSPTRPAVRSADVIHRGTQIRIIRPIPAPLMDGFDVSNFRFGAVYDVDRVDGRTANYLLIAGYAVQVEAGDDSDSPR